MTRHEYEQKQPECKHIRKEFDTLEDYMHLRCAKMNRTITEFRCSRCQNYKIAGHQTKE